MKRLLIMIMLVGTALLSGCQQQQVTKEKHSSTTLQQETTADQAMREAATMDQTPEKIDSGPMEIHRETIVEKVESEEVVIE